MRPKSALSRGRARIARSMRLAIELGVADARVDGARVVVGAGVGLDAAAHPLGGAAEAVEVGVADDGVDGADARDELGRDHLGARAVLGLGREHEARIAGVLRVQHVVVVIDPRGEARAEAVDEGLGELVEAAARGLRREGDVEHDDAPAQLGGAGKLSGRGEGELGSVGSQ